MGDDVFPTYTEAEVKADAIVHAIGVTAGCIAAITLVVIALEQLPATAATAIVVYAFGMLAMFCFSAAYNLSRGPKRWLLKRCDHAAIFIKIAATYTPFAAAKMGGTSAFSCSPPFGASRSPARRRNSSSRTASPACRRCSTWRRGGCAFSRCSRCSRPCRRRR